MIEIILITHFLPVLKLLANLYKNDHPACAI